MSVLVWVMGDGERRDMIATCRSGDGNWLTFRWDYREVGGMLGFRHDTMFLADDQLAGWTKELEADGASFIAQPTEIIVNTPEDSWDVTVMGWWNSVLRPIAVDIGEDWEAEPDDEVCTMTLPTAMDPVTVMDSSHRASAFEGLAVDPRLIMCGPPPLKRLPDPYRAKLSWGP